jgi:aminopeptidase N
MAWFDDVWLKEVFANFMAAKIVNPAFPEIDHDQAFLVDHYPKAYAVDRTEGANPIKQDLDNMNMAGTLYGSIIYHKAPVVMLQLENMIGEETLKRGLRQYLNTYSYGNADWDDLVGILDILTDDDLASWSEVWVKEPGMPAYEVVYEKGERILVQTDPLKGSRRWPQMLHPVFIVGDEIIDHTILVQELKTEVPINLEADRFFVNGNGEGYGYFKYSERDLDYLTAEALFSYSAKFRSSVYMSVWENLLNGNLSPISMADAFSVYLKNENDELNINLLLGYYKNFFWKYSDRAMRQSLVKWGEPILWDKIQQEKNSSVQSAYYKTYQATALSATGMSNLFHIWNGELNVDGLQLSSNDLTTLAFELAVRSDLDELQFEVDHVLEYQQASIENPDKKKRMAFIIPSLSRDEEVRDAFFESLKDPSNREHEPWVQTALHYLHHPLRASQSEKYIQPSLHMLQEIQETGDIFFPMGWLQATLSGHQSAKAAGIVKIYLNNNPNLDPKLRLKVLQAADPLFRASKMVSK